MNEVIIPVSFADVKQVITCGHDGLSGGHDAFVGQFVHHHPIFTGKSGVHDDGRMPMNWGDTTDTPMGENALEPWLCRGVECTDDRPAITSDDRALQFMGQRSDIDLIHASPNR
jgi:hypothetical protein